MLNLIKKRMNGTKKQYDLKFFCPISNCENANKRIEWSHSNCGGKFTIASDAIITCKKCKKKFKLSEVDIDCKKGISPQKVNYKNVIVILRKIHESLEIDDEDFFVDLSDSVKIKYKNNKDEKDKKKQ